MRLADFDINLSSPLFANKDGPRIAKELPLASTDCHHTSGNIKCPVDVWSRTVKGLGSTSILVSELLSDSDSPVNALIAG